MVSFVAMLHTMYNYCLNENLETTSVRLGWVLRHFEQQSYSTIVIHLASIGGKTALASAVRDE